MERQLHILLVDDNPADVLLTRLQLEAMDPAPTLDVAYDGEQAMQRLRQDVTQQSFRPDLILLDLNLPGRTGLQILTELKSDPRLRAIPVMILSGSRADRDVEAAYQSHATAYLAKPHDLDGYERMAAGIQQFWAKVATLPTAGSPAGP